MHDERPYPRHGDILFKGDLDIHLNMERVLPRFPADRELSDTVLLAPRYYSPH